MKIYEIEYTGSAQKISMIHLEVFELRTLLFKCACSKSHLHGWRRRRRRREHEDIQRPHRAAGNILAGKGSQLVSMYTVIKR